MWDYLYNLSWAAYKNNTFGATVEDEKPTGKENPPPNLVIERKAEEPEPIELHPHKAESGEEHTREREAEEPEPIALHLHNADGEGGYYAANDDRDSANGNQQKSSEKSAEDRKEQDEIHEGDSPPSESANPPVSRETNTNRTNQEDNV